MMKQLVNKHLNAMQSDLHEVEELAAHLEESKNSIPLDFDSNHGYEEIPFDFQIDEEVKEVLEEEREEENKEDLAKLEESKRRFQNKLIKPVVATEAKKAQSLLSKINLSQQTNNFLKANNILSKLSV